MERVDILKKAVDEYGKEAQLRMVIEECSELIKAVCKHLRNGGHEDDICEEAADVQIMIDQIRLMFGSTKEIESAKLERLAKKLGIDF